MAASSTGGLWLRRARSNQRTSNSFLSLALLVGLAGWARASCPMGRSPLAELPAQAGRPHERLIVCPKPAPQFPAAHVSPTLERQQRQLLRHLNQSFAHHLQLDGAPAGAPEPQPSDLIDDELLNEIVSPLMLDDAYARAKELIVRRRKFENELVRQGKCVGACGRPGRPPKRPTVRDQPGSPLTAPTSPTRRPTSARTPKASSPT